jgi:predicted MFS family arabinose efflux permease
MTQPSSSLTARSNVPMTVFSFVGAVTFSAASSAPTPLYPLYQHLFHLSPAMITIIFGSYAFALLAALLTFGGLSDFLGRKPLILLALFLNAGALTIFAFAESGQMLILARIVQGFGTGIAFPTFGATILDTDRQRAPILNGTSAFLGLTVGSLFGGALVAYAPLPTSLVYLVLLAITAMLIVALAAMPETASRRPGALKALRPNISVPVQARSTLIKVTPINVAGWSLGGFYLSLMPATVTAATGIVSPFIGGAVVATLMLSGTASVFIFRQGEAQRVLRMVTGTLVIGVITTLAGVHFQLVGLLFIGTAIAGIGFGANFANILRALLPLASPTERAELFAAFLVESYLAFAIPAILAGLAAPMLGLSQTAYAYGGIILLLAAISVVITRSGLTEEAA